MANRQSYINKREGFKPSARAALALVRRYPGLILSRRRPFFQARLAFFALSAAELAAAFGCADAAFAGVLDEVGFGAAVLGVACLVFLARDLVPAPCLSSIKWIASSSVIVSGDMPAFKVALVLPRLT